MKTPLAAERPSVLRSAAVPLPWAAGLVLSMHFFGFLAMLWPPTRDFFVALTPLTLLTCALLLLHYHQRPGAVFALACALMYAGGLGVEILGVQTGKIFGQYQYGEVLGWKLMDTPLMIGLNWLLLIYATTALCMRLPLHTAAQCAIAAAAMVLLDVLIEPVAIHLGFWHWFGQPVPLQNYVAWFVVAFALIGLFMRLKAPQPNPLAATVLASQTGFFAAHNLALWWLS